MSLLLLAFGALLTAAGILLATFGVSIRDHTFDTSIITPGVVATVGGFLLIGLGLALRVLQRIEHALAVRSMQRGEPALAAQPEPTPVRTARLQPPPVAASPVSAENPAEESPEKTPLIARLEATRLIAETDASRSPNPAMPFPTSVDIAVAQVDKAQTAKRKNGAASPPRMPSRLDVAARSPIASERPAAPSFDALWPKTQQSARTMPPPPVSALSPMTAEPEQVPEPAADASDATAEASESVSVLKSGVVDGMAYTLYSDGSIEAQLPQGILRFGSIAELRNHIERSA